MTARFHGTISAVYAIVALSLQEIQYIPPHLWKLTIIVFGVVIAAVAVFE
jgi:hypothetical protein